LDEGFNQVRRFIFVVGSTASGKSDWALQQAEVSGGVIFNCDSVQLYQKVQIGAAKPSAEDFARVPHFLFNVVPPPREITSGDYRDLFLKELVKLDSSTPIYVVGGTGFYFLALEKGLYEIEEPSQELKEQIQQEAGVPRGIERLLKETQEKDPEYGAKLHLNDHYRITRAIEILRSNPGKTISELRKGKKSATGLEGEIKKVGLRWSPSELEKRIRKRTQKMLSEGLLEETQSLLAEGLRDWAPLKSVGYRESVACLEGKMPPSNLEEAIVISTRQLAKKQKTWFQRDPEIQWIDQACQPV
jgi:tRNA dimethylallyltransferase